MDAMNTLLSLNLRQTQPATDGVSPRLLKKAMLDAPFTPPAADGSIVEIAPGLLWARMPMPMALDHINVYLLRSDTGWTIVDTGLNTDAARDCWETIAREHLQGLPIEALICTHFHYDHAGLARWLTQRFNVPLYMTLGEFMTMRVLNTRLPEGLPPSFHTFYQRAGMPDERLQRVVKVLLADPFMPPTMPHYRRLRGGQVLTIGTRAWRIIIGEGHSPEHACLYCEEEGLLIAGDQLLPGISSNVLVNDIEPDGNPLQAWFDSLERLEVCRAGTLVLPSHQNVFRGVHQRVQELREHHLHQFAVLLGHLEQSPDCTAFDAMTVLFPRLRHPMDDMLALGETLAHLAWLVEAGRVRCAIDEGGVARYMRVAMTTDNEEMHW